MKPKKPLKLNKIKEELQSIGSSFNPYLKGARSAEYQDLILQQFKEGVGEYPPLEDFKEGYYIHGIDHKAPEPKISYVAKINLGLPPGIQNSYLEQKLNNIFDSLFYEKALSYELLDRVIQNRVLAMSRKKSAEKIMDQTDNMAARDILKIKKKFIGILNKVQKAFHQNAFNQNNKEEVDNLLNGIVGSLKLVDKSFGGQMTVNKRTSLLRKAKSHCSEQFAKDEKIDLGELSEIIFKSRMQFCKHWNSTPGYELKFGVLAHSYDMQILAYQDYLDESILHEKWWLKNRRKCFENLRKIKSNLLVPELEGKNSNDIRSYEQIRQFTIGKCDQYSSYSEKIRIMNMMLGKMYSGIFNTEKNKLKTNIHPVELMQWVHTQDDIQDDVKEKILKMLEKISRQIQSENNSNFAIIPQKETSITRPFDADREIHNTILREIINTHQEKADFLQKEKEMIHKKTPTSDISGLNNETHCIEYIANKTEVFARNTELKKLFVKFPNSKSFKEIKDLHYFYASYTRTKNVIEKNLPHQYTRAILAHFQTSTQLMFSYELKLYLQKAITQDAWLDKKNKKNIESLIDYIDSEHNEFKKTKKQINIKKILTDAYLVSIAQDGITRSISQKNRIMVDSGKDQINVTIPGGAYSKQITIKRSKQLNNPILEKIGEQCRSFSVVEETMKKRFIAQDK